MISNRYLNTIHQQYFCYYFTTNYFSASINNLKHDTSHYASTMGEDIQNPDRII